jgi:hypothetical protein
MRQILFLLVCLSFATAQAQTAPQGVCGTDYRSEGYDLLDTRLTANLRTAASGPVAARNTAYVPIKFHLGARNDGSGRPNENDVLDQLCELNEDYLPYDIQFFLADGTFNYINNTTFYENHSATQNSIMSFQKDARALNVYIVENADTGGGGEGGVTLAYYSPPRDWIVITKTYIKRDDATLSHEIGHYFSLPHTFSGWEVEPYNTQNVSAPANSPSGNATERANGTNCETSGDRICDTPADYNNGLGWGGCDFTLNVLDPQGNPIDPQERNYMGYFLRCPDDEYLFTNQQNAIIQADLASFGRNFLRLDPVPPYAEITTSPTPIYPINNEITPNYNAVNLEWAGVANANAYLLEISRVSSFTIEPIRIFVYGTTKVINGLDAGRRYYWRVRPVNAHSTCISASAVTSFTTGDVVANQELSFVESFQVSPNPVVGQSNVQINLTSAEAFVGQIQILDITGRPTGVAQEYSFGAGNQLVNLPIGQLSNGVYVLQILTQQGRLAQKVVIAQ